jgi:hypothetical protein
MSAGKWDYWMEGKPAQGDIVSPKGVVRVMGRDRRPPSFYVLAGFFGLFVLFLYGPIATVVLLSFQGPHGGLTFPMQGLSVHWFLDLFRPQSIGDIWGPLAGRSCSGCWSWG